MIPFSHFLPPCMFKISCQALSLSLLLLWERADTIITLYHTTTTTNFLSTLELTYTQVWYIIGIVSSSPTHFHSEKIGLIRVTYDPPVSIRVNKYLKSCYLSLSLFFLSLSLFSLSLSLFSLSFFLFQIWLYRAWL